MWVWVSRSEIHAKYGFPWFKAKNVHVWAGTSIFVVSLVLFAAFEFTIQSDSLDSCGFLGQSQDRGILNDLSFPFRKDLHCMQEIEAGLEKCKPICPGMQLCQLFLAHCVGIIFEAWKT